ncbi:MFS transporter [Ureibacillus sp. FSL K6-8385]|uniref:MFS transporter n=1 Tax=Ureibacillus terrenus TaxID=118246 RepID=A0A540V0N3_9BACL|nr:MFS transporter [Ureibacillus terrenus]MED3764450.1 MFS transporter [Ureibacillus terrenus]TQE89783.1 MFS transporter [Ureibacillus terrenus]
MKMAREFPLTFSTFLFFLAIIFFATTVRTPITGVGTIISYIRDDLGISNTLAGFLTTIPLLAFAIVSPFAPKIARRLGMEHTLFYSLVLLTIGIFIRSAGNISLLIIGTILIGVAISFGNVLFPSFFKAKYPSRVGLLTGIYTVSMNISAAASLAFSQPVAELSGWQGALGCTVILVIVTMVAWIPILRSEKVSQNQSGNGQKAVKVWKSPLAWAIAMAMGTQSLLFYCSTAWIPEILVSQGLRSDQAGWMASVFQLSQMPMTFFIPLLAEKLSSQRPIVYFFTLCYLIGFGGLLFQWTGGTLIWMILLGLAAGASFGLVLMFFTLRTRTAYEASEISGFAQSFGYLIAAIGPVLFGFIQEATGSWALPNILFIAASLILFIFSFISSKNRYI